MPEIPPMQDPSKWRLMSENASPQLKPLDGMSDTYKQWIERIHDHANLVNPNLETRAGFHEDANHKYHVGHHHDWLA